MSETYRLNNSTGSTTRPWNISNVPERPTNMYKVNEALANALKSSKTDETTSAEKKAAKYAAWATGVSIFGGVMSAAVAGVGIYKTCAEVKAMNAKTAGMTGGNAQQTSSESSTAKQSADDLNKAVADAKNNGKVEELRSKVNADTQAQQAQASTIENMGTEAQAKVDSATNALAESNKSYEAAKSQLSGAKEAENAAERDAEAADKACSSAQSSYDEASKGLETANSELSTAQADFDNCPANSPAKAGLGTKLAAAKSKVAAAETAKANAKAALEKAITEKQTKNDAKAKAQKNRADLEEKVKQCEIDIKAKRTELSSAQTALKTAKAEQVKARAANQKWATSIQTAQAELANYSAPAAATAAAATTDVKVNPFENKK